MPASHKMLTKQKQKQNQEAGIGDKDGKLPAKAVKVIVKAKCAVCQIELQVSKTNMELKAHMNKHPKSTFAFCFPGQLDPDAKTE
jgi:hypothetical protein